MGLRFPRVSDQREISFTFQPTHTVDASRSVDKNEKRNRKTGKDHWSQIIGGDDDDGISRQSRSAGVTWRDVYTESARSCVARPQSYQMNVIHGSRQRRTGIACCLCFRSSLADTDPRVNGRHLSTNQRSTRERTQVVSVFISQTEMLRNGYLQLKTFIYSPKTPFLGGWANF